MRPRIGQLIGTGRGAALLGLLVAAPLALSACSGNTSGTSASSRAAGAPQAAKQNTNGFAAPGASSGSADSAAGKQTGSTAAALAQTGRSLIITAGLQVKTGDAAAAAAKAQQVVQAAGGFVAGESIGSGSQSMPSTTSGGGSAPNGSGAAPDVGTPSPLVLPEVTGASDTTQALLVLRVPPPQLDPVLRALTGKGDEVTYQSRTATDVTGQVADVASRVTSAQAAIAELRTLIDKAASMNDLISLEQALAQRESDLESLQAQQKALTDQVQYATITVGYYSQGQPVAPPPVRTGFMRGLTTGWHAFTRTVRAVLVAVGWLVPFIILIAVLWWPVRRLVRWNRGRARGAAMSPALATAGPATPETPTSPSSEE